MPRLIPRSPDRRQVLAVTAAGVAFPTIVRAEAPAASILYGCQSGQETLDEGHGGGNPFASALVECLADRRLALSDLPTRLRSLTTEKSEGFQAIDAPYALRPASYRLADASAAGRRTALVMIISAYSHRDVPDLPGAARDGRRISEALARAGYDVTYRADPDPTDMIAMLGAFSTRSRSSEAAVVYATGHGVEHDGAVRLLARDYIPGQGVARLPQQSLAISTLAAAAKARTVNLAFWAGCRSPFTY